MNKIIFTLMVMSGYAFASAHGAEAEAGTDIVQRTVNFLIFAGIVYYLIAEPVKNYFNGRSEAIASELEKVQEKLRESKEAKAEAVQGVADAKVFAKNLLETAKKENKLLNDKIMKQCEVDLDNLTQQNNSLMEFEKREMIRSMVSEVMSDVLKDGETTLDEKTMADIITKKVA